MEIHHNNDELRFRVLLLLKSIVTCHGFAEENCLISVYFPSYCGAGWRWPRGPGDFLNFAGYISGVKIGVVKTIFGIFKRLKVGCLVNAAEAEAAFILTSVFMVLLIGTHSTWRRLRSWRVAASHGVMKIT